MRKTRQTSGERIVKDIKRKTRKQYSAEEKIQAMIMSAFAGKSGHQKKSDSCS